MEKWKNRCTISSCYFPAKKKTKLPFHWRPLTMVNAMRWQCTFTLLFLQIDGLRFASRIRWKWLANGRYCVCVIFNWSLTHSPLHPPNFSLIYDSLIVIKHVSNASRIVTTRSYARWKWSWTKTTKCREKSIKIWSCSRLNRQKCSQSILLRRFRQVLSCTLNSMEYITWALSVWATGHVN